MARILIVDDFAGMAEALARNIHAHTDNKHHIDTARSIAEANDRFAVAEYDIEIWDGSLTGHLDPDGAREAIRRSLEGKKTMVFSSNESALLLAKMNNVPALFKPGDMDEILVHIERLTAGKEADTCHGS